MSAKPEFASAEFDTFALKPVQSAILETIVTVYKPIETVDQSDLEFLIPDTKIHITDKLTKMEGTALDG